MAYTQHSCRMNFLYNYYREHMQCNKCIRRKDEKYWPRILYPAFPPRVYIRSGRTVYDGQITVPTIYIDTGSGCSRGANDQSSRPRGHFAAGCIFSDSRVHVRLNWQV